LQTPLSVANASSPGVGTPLPGGSAVGLPGGRPGSVVARRCCARPVYVRWWGARVHLQSFLAGRPACLTAFFYAGLFSAARRGLHRCRAGPASSASPAVRPRRRRSSAASSSFAATLFLPLRVLRAASAPGLLPRPTCDERRSPRGLCTLGTRTITNDDIHSSRGLPPPSSFHPPRVGGGGTHRGNSWGGQGGPPRAS